MKWFVILMYFGYVSDVVCIICSAGLLQLFHLGMECCLMNVDGCYVLQTGTSIQLVGNVVLQHVGLLNRAEFMIGSWSIRLMHCKLVLARKQLVEHGHG